jgi:predicted nucleotidyltransferase component of viral defense system
VLVSIPGLAPAATRLNASLEEMMRATGRDHRHSETGLPHGTRRSQDLILSRALVEIFRAPDLAKAFLRRGGTALYKLFATEKRRYSEDIDLVQVASAIGTALEWRARAPDAVTPWRDFRLAHH